MFLFVLFHFLLRISKIEAVSSFALFYTLFLMIHSFAALAYCTCKASIPLIYCLICAAVFAFNLLVLLFMLKSALDELNRRSQTGGDNN